ncbi:MAG: 50S ribosomal protein L24 [Deltaproteobacteria bacterium]|nr:50S ribosomal protein L24 [Deltaproteobacteria bacterium]
MSRHVRKGDQVMVIAGKYKGQKGKVLEVLTAKGRVRIEGIATVKRHLKPGRDPKVPQGGIIEKFGTIHVSNVLPLDPSGGKPTRVSYKALEDGRKVRVARGSKEIITDVNA